ncbi:single-stranded DNA-binding protein [Staphylococcus hyicus]|uniref:single-stranded DNA-binding protein n=1 Tax=Staphylococcus hyicus TaxID=1284 RepID=UPI003132A985
MNKLILSGRLAKEVEIKEVNTEKGTLYKGKGTIAVNKGKDQTLFYPFIVWNKTAKNLAELSTKGSRVILTGSIDQYVFKDDNDKKSYYNFMKLEAFEIVDTKEETEELKHKQEKVKEPFNNSDKASLYDVDLDSFDEEDLPF